MSRLSRSIQAVLVLPLLLLATALRANNIQVTNAALANNNNIAGTVDVQFDLSWENSWRGGSLAGTTSRCRAARPWSSCARTAAGH